MRDVRKDPHCIPFGAKMKQLTTVSAPHKVLSRGINYLGALGARLRDLQGFATLAFELIQNADDAPNATEITFTVSDAGVVVENDGQFSDCGLADEPECCWPDDPRHGHLCDFHRFREVSGGDKREQFGTAGAFGVGFTAVYQVTDRPELISSGKHWLIYEERPEQERIEECQGCVKCLEPGFRGTRFYLPWASDPNSDLRRHMRAPATASDSRQQLLEELKASTPEAMLFLKQLSRVEIFDSTKRVARFERLPEDTGVIINDGRRDTTWRIISTDFDEAAEALRTTWGDRIERKRTAKVRIAIPDDPIRAGLLCAFLPTQQETGLPFHINADFFTQSDRKTVILESDYQSQWNRSAIRAAAEALAEHLSELPKSLGTARTWQVIDAIHTAYLESREGKRDSVFQAFWEKVSAVLPSSPVAECTNGEFACPSDVLVFQDVEERDALPVLTALGLRILRPELRQHVFHLPGRAGVQVLDVSHIVAALHGIGLGQRCLLSSLPQTLQKKTSRGVLFAEFQRLLNRKKPQDQQRALELISGCAVFLASDGAAWPSREIYGSDSASITLISKICPHIPFSTGEVHKAAPMIAAAVPQLSSAVVIGYLESQPFALDRAAAPALLRWFESHKGELESARNLKARLAALPIFPSTAGLKPLQTLALTGGGFSDPLGVTDLVDLTGLSSLRGFLVEIGARELTFENYAATYLPRAIRGGAQLTLPKVRAIIELLGARLGEIRDNVESRSALASLPLIECTDGQTRLPVEVYFTSEAVETVLGTAVSFAAIRSRHRESVTDLYRWLGVAQVPRWEDVTERIAELTKRSVAAGKAQIEKIVNHIGERVRTFDELPAELRRLQQLCWLPARGFTDHWFRPSELYLVYREYIFSTQAKFVDLSQTVQQTSGQFLRLLGTHDEPAVAQVVAHLLCCAASGAPVNKQVYGFLNEHLADPAILALRGKRCLMVADGKYVDPRQVFWSAHPFGRFRAQLGTELFKYSELLTRVGVRPSPTSEDALAVLEEVSAEYGDRNARIDEHCHQVVMRCWTMLTSGLEGGQISEKVLHPVASKKVIPAPNGILDRPTLMFFEDRAGLAAKFPKLLKNNVIRCPEGAWGAMAAAGVRFLTSVVSSRIVDVLNPTLDSVIGARISSRRGQLARVLDPVASGTGHARGLEALNDLQCFSAGQLVIQFSIEALNRRDLSKVEEVKAHFDGEAKSLYFVPQEGEIPWAAIAREISAVLNGEAESGRIALALMHVLSAPDLQSASTLLDELGFPPIEQTDITVDSPAPVTDLGQEGAIVPPPPDGAGTSGPTGGTPQPGESPAAARHEEGPAAPPSQPFHPPAGTAGADTAGGGSTQAATPEAKGGSGYTKRSKLRTYVVPEGAESTANEGQDSGDREVDEAGIQHVCEFEILQERHPTVMRHENEGFDIESTDADGFIQRYIEVKSCSGNWKIRARALSKPQFEYARTQGDRYWLYVVERAASLDFTIYRIKDPARRVTEFLYDDGWSALAEMDDTSPGDVPPNNETAE